jgi:protein ImuB
VDGVSRIACARVEAFAAAAVERCEPGLREQPLAVVTGAAPATRVVEANAHARAAGVRPGLSDAEAGVRCPGLVRRAASADAEAAARHALLEACLTVSPRLEDAGPGIVHLDLTGLHRLFGGDSEIAARLRRQARAVGLEIRVGVAGTRTAAEVAARVGPAVNVLPRGGERAALAAVPLAALEWPEALATTFTRWGLDTLGDLATLPREGLGTRLGPAGLDAHDRASGVDRAPWIPWTPPAFWEEAQGLDYELDTLLALVPVLDRVLGRLCARLTAAHLVADALDIRLSLVSGGHHARSMTLAAPMGDAVALTRLLALEIEAHPPSAAVVGVAISAHVVPRRAAATDLWQPPAPAPRELAGVLARLTTLVGGANVGAPVALDSHRPDPSALTTFSGQAGPPTTEMPPARRPHDRDAQEETGEAGSVDGTAPCIEAAAGVLALRRLRPPRAVTVETQDGRPTRVTDPVVGTLAVATCAGPWRASGDWWDVEVWAHDEWDVALADNTVWRLAHDRLTNTWSLDGVYD